MQGIGNAVGVTHSNKNGSKNEVEAEEGARSMNEHTNWDESVGKKLAMKDVFGKKEFSGSNFSNKKKSSGTTMSEAWGNSSIKAHTDKDNGSGSSALGEDTQ